MRATLAQPAVCPVNRDLVAAIKELPLAEFGTAVEQQLNGLQKVTANGCTSPKVGPFQIHAFLAGDAQAVVVSVEGRIPPPYELVDESAAELLGGATLTDPLVVLSLVSGTLATKELDDSLKKIIGRSYFNVESLDVRSGIQIIARGGVDGALGKSIQAMGFPASDFIITLGQKKGLPSAPSEMTGRSSNSAGTSAGDEARSLAKLVRTLKQLKDKRDKKAAGEKLPRTPPDYFIELQTAPGTTINGPLGMSPVRLSEAMIFATSLGTMGYKGYVSFADLPNRRFLGFFEAPYDAAGALKLTDFKFGLAAPSLGLDEFARISMSFASPQAPRGGFIPNLNAMKAPLEAMLKPLSMFRVENPNPVPEYRYADPQHPFPAIGAFNVLLLGPLAKETMGGKQVPGPLVKLLGNASVMGKTVGRMDVYLSEHGLNGMGAVDLGTLDLSHLGLGRPGVRGQAGLSVAAGTQSAGVNGQISLPEVTRGLDLGFGSAKITVESKANCALPITLSGDLPYPTAAPSLGDLAHAINGANVDPKTIANCAGEDLKKAYKWIENNGAKLGGYTVAAAKEAGKALEQGGKAVAGAVVDAGKASVDAAKAAEEASRRAAEAAASAAAGAAAGAAQKAAKAARDIANGAIAGANQVVHAIGSAFGGSSTPYCNQVHGWLNDRQRESDHARLGIQMIPTNASIDDLVGRLFVPLIGTVGKADAYILHVDETDARWKRAASSYVAIADSWNARAKAGHGTAVVQPFQSYAPSASPATRVLGQLRATRTNLSLWDAANRGYFNEWAGFRKYAEGFDNGRLNQGTAQWYRCARVHTANIPVRMAQAWKTYVPPAVGGHIEAQFTSPQNYRQVEAGLIQSVGQRHAELDQLVQPFNQFVADWTSRSAKFAGDLNARIESLVSAPARALMSNPAQANKQGPALEEWNKAAHGMRQVLNGLLFYTADPRLAVLDVDFYLAKYADLNAGFRNDHGAAMRHWLEYGINEGRQPSAEFDLRSYRERNADLRGAGNADLLNHWLAYGQHEGRIASPDGTRGPLLTPDAKEAAQLVDRVFRAAEALNKAAEAPK
jgi:hypothetical protein